MIELRSLRDHEEVPYLLITLSDGKEDYVSVASSRHIAKETWRLLGSLRPYDVEVQGVKDNLPFCPFCMTDREVHRLYREILVKIQNVKYVVILR